MSIRAIQRGRALLRRKRELLVPTHVSWRVAHHLEAAGEATLYPYFNRWQGKLSLIDHRARVALKDTEA